MVETISIPRIIRIQTHPSSWALKTVLYAKLNIVIIKDRS